MFFCMNMDLDSSPWTKPRNKLCLHPKPTTRQYLSIQTLSSLSKQTTAQTQKHSSNMVPSIFVLFLLFLSFISPVFSLQHLSETSGHRFPANQTFRPAKELLKLKRVNAFLRKINKPAVKTIQASFLFFFLFYRFYGGVLSRMKLSCSVWGLLIWVFVIYYFSQSPDGDIIDCVQSHLQPAFEHPELRGQKPLVTFCLSLFVTFIFNLRQCGILISNCNVAN